MSIREIKKNEVYQIIVPIGYDQKGKPIRIYENFHGGIKQARLREGELKLQNQEGTYIKKSNLTFEGLSQEYLEVQKNHLSPKTFVNYEYRLQVINQHIGFMKLKDLNPKVLERFYSYMKNEYISDKTKRPINNTTLQHYYCVINNVLEQAVKWEYIKSNPNSKVNKPKREKNEISYYTPEEVDKLIKCIQNEPLKYQAIIYMALDLGCRRGELTGLTWEDIDLKTGKVYINKTTQAIKGRGIVEKETKTENSTRINFISRTTMNVLKEYKKEQNKKKLLLGSKWGNSTRVFTTEEGLDMHPDTPSYILDKIIQKYNLKRITFHGLRHTSVSLMISKGIQAQIISRKVGHSSVQTTDRIYSHFFEKEFEEVSNVMNDILSQAN